jgi:hypothetical protein
MVSLEFFIDIILLAAMVANSEQNLVHLLDSMVHHCRTVNSGNWMTIMGKERGRREEEEEDTFRKMCLLCTSVPCSVLGQLQ